MRILVTGAAGFIGAALSKQLLKVGENVYGIDNLNSYYSQKLKSDRIKNIENDISALEKWNFEKCDLTDDIHLNEIFMKFSPDVVVNLAAQAGVRYSIKEPTAYISSNIVGFNNILEKCVKFKVRNLIYASSSSVYGINKKESFKEDHPVNHPISLYAATKRSNELIAHTYSHIFGLPSTGLRFFTVYGPWGRPDMAPMIFTKAILEKQPLDIYNFGKMQRDFTFINDITEAIIRCCYKPASIDEDFDFNIPNASTSFAPHRIFNVGNSNPVKLLDFVETLENELGIKAKLNLKSIQKGDVTSTISDTKKLKEWINFKPQTSLKQGINKFINWYKGYY